MSFIERWWYVSPDVLPFMEFEIYKGCREAILREVLSA